MPNIDRTAPQTPISAAQVIQNLSRMVPKKMERNIFFQILSQQLRKVFYYDRFCINLYDSEREFLNMFTAADGTIIESLANTRIAKNTVAALAISSRKPVVISNLASYNTGGAPLPLATVGLNSTIALPLIMNRVVIATLHVSFVQQPENVVEILNFLLAISPVLTVLLFAVLAEERSPYLRVSRSTTAVQDDSYQRLLERQLLETKDMARVMSVVNKVAKLQLPVMITGETGTGKSMLARYVHAHSLRKQANFVKVNCPSLAPTLFESEMFGYAKGAFTGAYAKRIGRIELAQDGTLFLDEIGELSPNIQSKLLQVLEDQSFERVGEALPINVNIRIVSATNIDLAEAMADGRLRRDLFYRLASVVLHMPALRQRKNDIPMLVDYFSQQFSQQFEIRPQPLSPTILQELCAYAWPGNLRELRNVVSQLLLHSLEGPLTGQFVQEVLYEGGIPQLEATKTVVKERGHAGLEAARATSPEKTITTLEEHERTHIMAVLQHTGGRLSGPRGAAVLLGIPRSTLQHKMRKLGIK